MVFCISGIFVSVPQRPSGAGEWNSSHAVRCGGDGCKNHYRLYAHRPMGIYGDLYGEPAGMDRGVYSVMAVLSDSDS